MQDFFLIWQDVGLLLYSVLKAFLPLPSLEVILTPLCLKNPQKWVIYAMEGAIGTCVGGAIGYMIAKLLGKKAFSSLVSEEDMQKGEDMVKRYGVVAVFIGGITPLPDFLLAYLAGFTHMSLPLFLISDGSARLLRSLVVFYGLKTLKTILPFDAFGIWFSLFILVYFLFKWGYKRVRTYHIKK